MDDETSTTTTTKAVLAVAALLLLALPAREAFGDRGVEAVLLVVLVVVAVLAYGELTGKPVPRLRPAGSATPAAAPEAPDEWRSERWVREAVDRGLRALDDWRLEQREA